MSNKTWIQSHSGQKVDLLKPDPETITIEDIAWALSHLNRYTGHASRAYSVAEHSIHVMRRALHRFNYEYDRMWSFFATPSELEQECLRVQRWALLHDATEAYLVDVSRPLKRLREMSGYRALEKRWEKLIRAKFLLESDPPPEVAAADAELLGTEARQLMQPVHPEWGATCPGGMLPDSIKDHPRIAVAPWFFGAWRARRAFMKEFRRLFPEVA